MYYFTRQADSDQLSCVDVPMRRGPNANLLNLLWLEGRIHQHHSSTDLRFLG